MAVIGGPKSSKGMGASASFARASRQRHKHLRTLIRRGREGVSMSTEYVNSPEHWRKRAVQMRTLSDWIEDAATKATMLELADQYDGLARVSAVPTPNPSLTSGEIPRFGP